MKISFDELRIHTASRIDLVDVTRDVEDKVRESGVDQGVCLVYLPHATAAIVVNEHESGLMQDILKEVDALFPNNVSWLHNRIDDNARAHVASAMLGSSETFPIKEGRLVRGRWQNIFLLELDGPRERRVTIEILGE